MQLFRIQNSGKLPGKKRLQAGLYMFMNSQKRPGTTSLKRHKRLMLFDLEYVGHHAAYIRHLVQYWEQNRLPVELYVIVAPEFVQKYEHLVKTNADNTKASVQFLPISESESQSIRKKGNAFSQLSNRLEEWRLMCKYTAELEVDHCLILYLDTCEFPLSLGLKPPCPISGIYFRPTFHYQDFAGHHYAPESWLKRLRERLFIHRMVHNPKLHMLFCLGPFAAEAIRELYPQAQAIALADPVEIPQIDSLNAQALLEKHGVSPGRKVFLLFGAITARKGIYQLLEALEKLPAEVCRQICILIVGEVNSAEKPRLCTQIESVCKAQPVQIITHFEFVSDVEMQCYYCLADFVLALYQRHVGMSGILLLAAAAQKPVLSSDYGLMGELVRRYQLGIAVDSGCSEAIAAAISRLLKSEGSFYDIEKMKTFVEENAAVRFAQTIFQHTG